ncbi:transposable element Tcb2 transposase [Trichonephila clavipes]|nr:transposable element Tcb2 transposase [Trichonephila clavipes]
MVTDNAKTFKRSELELKNLWKVISDPAMKAFYASHKIHWQFIIELQILNKPPGYSGEGVITLVQRRCSRLFSSVCSIPVCLVCVVNKRLSLHPTGRFIVGATTSDRVLKVAVNKEKIRYVLQFIFDKGENASQLAEIVKYIYGPDTETANYVQFWFRRFGMPIVENVTKITEMIDIDKHDEVEKLAYQLNEEAERTERPIRRLSKVMYGSTCADMQVDVIRECLSSIKHVVGTTSGCFYPRSNHWEKLEEGRSVTSVAAEFGIAHSIVSRLWRQFQTTGTAIRGFSSGRPRGTTLADDRYIVLQARRNRRQSAGEIARHTTQATGRPISHFTVARRLHGGGLFARRPVRCVPLTPAHRIKRSLWCREHRNWRDNEWGRVLFTDESRFSLSSDSHRILIWRERGSRNHPSNIIERDRYGGRGVLVWGGIMLGSRTDLHIFDAGSVYGTRYCNEILLPYVRLFRGAMGLQFLFMDDNAPCHRTVAAEQLLESEDIEHMDWLARSPDLNPIEHVWDFLGRRLAARTLPPVTIRELRLALQDEWAAMPQQLIDTLILSMGRRCETCLAVRGDHIPY